MCHGFVCSYDSLADNTEQPVVISSQCEPLSTTPEGITDIVTPSIISVPVASISACGSSGEINPIIQSGDFGQIVKLKTQRSLAEDEILDEASFCSK